MTTKHENALGHHRALGARKGSVAARDMASKPLAVNTEKRLSLRGFMGGYSSGGSGRGMVDDEAKEPGTPATPQTPQSLALLASPSAVRVERSPVAAARVHSRCHRCPAPRFIQGGAQAMAPGRDNRLSKFKTFQSYNNELGMRGASTQSWVRLALQAISEGDERALRRIFQQNVRGALFPQPKARAAGTRLASHTWLL